MVREAVELTVSKPSPEALTTKERPVAAEDDSEVEVEAIVESKKRKRRERKGQSKRDVGEGSS